MNDIFQAALEVLLTDEPDTKIQLGRRLGDRWLARGPDNPPPEAGPEPARIEHPGRPGRPQLVHPRELRQRSLHTPEGRLVFMHAIAHIEFNAINLAWDAVYRFRGQPAGFYDDWIGVALDESRHFELVRDYLRKRGADYGDYPAHNGLWDMAVRTDHDVIVRMAIIPRVMEARGLDVTPAMIDRLTRAGDEDAAAILGVIYEEEIDHVAAGSRWFRFHCEQRDIDPDREFRELVATHVRGGLRGPFNNEGRLAAGFSETELNGLDQPGR